MNFDEALNKLISWQENGKKWDPALGVDFKAKHWNEFIPIHIAALQEITSLKKEIEELKQKPKTSNLF